jgi:hypothetical protein
MNIIQVSKSLGGFSVKLTNTGTAAIASGQIIKVKSFGAGTPTGSSLVATTTKGTFTGTDWTNGVNLTLSSDFVAAEEITITFAFASPAPSADGYTAVTSVIFIDPVSSLNSINTVTINMAAILPSIPIAPGVLTVGWIVSPQGGTAYVGYPMTGTASHHGTIQMLTNNNGTVVATTTTQGDTKSWSITPSSEGTYTFRLYTAEASSDFSSAVIVTTRPIITNTATSLPLSDTAKTANDTSSNKQSYWGLLLIIPIFGIIVWVLSKKD